MLGLDNLGSTAGSAVGTSIGGPVGGAVGNAVGNGLNGLVGSLTSSFTGIMSGTVGAVFANGLDLSCWGASNSPSQAKTEVPKDLQEIFNASGLSNNINSTTLNKYNELMNFYYERKLESAVNMSNASCTRKGNQVSADIALGVLREVIKQIKETHDVKILNTYSKGNFSFTFQWRGSGGTLTMSKSITLFNYQVTPKPQTNSGNSNNPDNPDNSNTANGGGSVFKTLGLGVLATIIAGKL